MPSQHRRSLRTVFAGTAIALSVMRASPLTASAVPSAEAPHFVQVSASRYSLYVAVDAPYGFVLGLTAAGDVYSWGASTSGALGLGPAMLETHAPTKVDLSSVVPSGDHVIQVEAGATSVLALTDEGRVLAWGRNDFGQLGLDDTQNRFTPTEVPRENFQPAIPSGKKIIKITMGASDWAMALTNSGSATSGTVYAWGDNSHGQLGISSPSGTRPQVRADLPADIALIAAGSASGYAVTSGGALYSWGNNDEGQLNRGNTTSTTAPGVRTAGYGTDPIVKIAAGSQHVVAVTSFNEVYTWGANGNGQLGDNSTANRASAVNIASNFLSIDGGGSLAALAAGENHSVALTTSGTVISWGDNQYGQLGRGDHETRYTLRQAGGLPAVGNGAPVSAIAAGDYSTFAVSSTGGIYGTGVQGSFGDASLATIAPGDEWETFTEAFSFTAIRLGQLNGSVSVGPLNPTVGSTLTASVTGYPSSAYLTYQWLRNGTAIAGATAASYTVTDTDVDRALSVDVTVRGENYGSVAATSAAVAVGAAPTITTESLAPSKPGVLFLRQISASGSATVTFSSDDLPDWLRLDAATGELSGISPEQAGDTEFAVTATNMYGEASKTFTASIVPGDTEVLVLTPSSTEVHQGDTVEFTLAGYDGYGNLVGDVTVDTELSSSVASDVIDGNRITFPHASPHVITGEAYESATGSLQIEVIPASTGGGSPPSGGSGGSSQSGDLESTGGPDVWASTLALGAGMLLVGGTTLVLARRRAAHRTQR